MTRPTPTPLPFESALPKAVREWIAANCCQPEETTQARKDEADANLDAALRCAGFIGLDQSIESIEATDDGVWLDLDNGQELSINASTGRVNRC